MTNNPFSLINFGIGLFLLSEISRKSVISNIKAAVIVLSVFHDLFTVYQIIRG